MKSPLAIVLTVLSFLVFPTFADEIDPLQAALIVYESGDEARAIELFTPLAEAGNVPAQNKLAHMYYWGEGTSRDFEVSHHWALRSANQSDAVGQYDVGSHYYLGRGVGQDIEIAISWIKKAALQNDAYALLSLADIYLRGEDVPKDNLLGLEYLRGSAAQGDFRAQYYLGSLLITGISEPDGLTADPVEGLQMLRLAAEQRSSAAQLLMSTMYWQGIGAQIDLVEATKWSILAAQGGCPKASLVTFLLSASIEASDFQKAADLARVWEEMHPALDPHDQRDYSMGEICETEPALPAQDPELSDEPTQPPRV